MFGHPSKEVIYLNEDTVWSGEPHDYTNVGAHRHFETLRQLIRDEKYEQAKEFGAEHLLGIPSSQQGYQHLGLLHLDFPGNAAGLAAAMSSKKGIMPRELEVAELQGAFRKDEVDLTMGGKI